MKKEDLMQAMSCIDENYLAEADRRRAHIRNKEKNMSKVTKFRTIRRVAVAAAAAVAISVILPNTSAGTAYAMSNIPVIGAYFHAVTFRHWDYTNGNSEAHVDVAGVEAGTGTSAEAQAKAESSAKLTNEQIAQKTDALIEEFKKSQAEGGNTALRVSTEVVTDSDDYYVVKLTGLQTAADSYEQNWYFVLSKKTGEQVKLADLFQPGSDYVGTISKYLIQAMKEDMAKNPDDSYFVDSDLPETDFRSITADQQFYIRSDNQLVICFNQGDVAPMYMGAQEFAIPDSVIAGIRR